MNEVDRQVQYVEDHQGDNLYGEQFGPVHPQVIDLIEKYIKGRTIEIGSGGGRYTRQLLVPELLSIDGTPASEKLIRQHMDCSHIEFEVCKDGVFLAKADSIFSFDVFVHFHPKLFLDYLHSCKQSLQPGGYFLLHYARYFPGLEYNARCFKYWDRDDVIAASGLEYIENIEFPSGFGSELLVLRQHE